LCTTGHWQSKPKDQDKLEGVVEWEPVDNADKTLKDSQESKDYPVRKPLCIISFADTEQSFQGVVSGNDKTGKVGEKLSTKVEEDEEKIG